MSDHLKVTIVEGESPHSGDETLLLFEELVIDGKDVVDFVLKDVTGKKYFFTLPGRVVNGISNAVTQRMKAHE